MDSMAKLEQAVGNEHLIIQSDYFLDDRRNNRKQADTTKIVSIDYAHQPNSNKVVSVKSVDA